MAHIPIPYQSYIQAPSCVHVISDHHIISLVPMLLHSLSFSLSLSMCVCLYHIYRTDQKWKNGKMILEMVVKTDWCDTGIRNIGGGQPEYRRGGNSSWSGIKLRDSVCVYVNWCGLPTRYMCERMGLMVVVRVSGVVRVADIRGGGHICGVVWDMQCVRNGHDAWEALCGNRVRCLSSWESSSCCWTQCYRMGLWKYVFSKLIEYIRSYL